MKLSQTQLEILVKKYINADTIHTRNSDSLDFYDVHIANIISMINDAYDIGVSDAKSKT